MTMAIINGMLISFPFFFPRFSFPKKPKDIFLPSLVPAQPYKHTDSQCCGNYGYHQINTDSGYHILAGRHGLCLLQPYPWENLW